MINQYETRPDRIKFCQTSTQERGLFSFSYTNMESGRVTQPLSLTVTSDVLTKRVTSEFDTIKMVETQVVRTVRIVKMILTPPGDHYSK